MAQKALELNGIARGVYLTLNPVHPDVLSRLHNRVGAVESSMLTSDANIAGRRWLLIEVDPVRIAEVNSTCARSNRWCV